MQISFKSRKLESSFVNEKAIFRSYGTEAKRVVQRLKELHAAETLDVMTMIPAAYFHLLKGERKNTFAVKISGNWRILLEPDHTPIPRTPDGGIDLKAISKIKILEVSQHYE